MPATPLGFVYPASTDNVQIWAHMQTLATGIDTYLSGTILPGAWQNPALLNSWTNRGAGFPALAYRKEEGGKVVRITGQILPGTKTNGTAIFTLAVGFRPITEAAGLMIFASNGNAGPELVISTAGSVTIDNIGAGTTVLLINVTFPLDAA